MEFRDLLGIEAEKLRKARQAAAQRKRPGVVSPREASSAKDGQRAGGTERRARDHRIARHKHIIIFLLVVAAALAIWALRVFEAQSEIIERQRQRAYLMPRIEAGEAIPAQPPLVIKISVDNTGLTAAYGVSAQLKVRVMKYFLTSAGIKAKEGEAHVYTSPPAVIKPGGEEDGIASVRITDSDLTPAEFELLRTRKNTTLYVTGTVNYRDAFNDLHFSDFCFGYRSDGKGSLESFVCVSDSDVD